MTDENLPLGSWLLGLVLIVAVASPIFVDRWEHVRAVEPHAKNPTPEYAKALDRQHHVTQKVREREALLVFCALFAALIFCEWTYRASLRSGSRSRITF